jgi:hypothetical protein
MSLLQKNQFTPTADVLPPPQLHHPAVAHQVAQQAVASLVVAWVADYFLTAKAHFAESATYSLVTIANWETHGHCSVIVAAANVAKNQP